MDVIQPTDTSFNSSNSMANNDGTMNYNSPVCLARAQPGGNPGARIPKSCKTMQNHATYAKSYNLCNICKIIAKSYKTCKIIAIMQNHATLCKLCKIWKILQIFQTNPGATRGQTREQPGSNNCKIMQNHAESCKLCEINPGATREQPGSAMGKYLQNHAKLCKLCKF